MATVSYSIGRFFGSHRVIATFGLVLLLGTCIYINSESEKAQRAEAGRATAEASEKAVKRRAEEEVAVRRRAEEEAIDQKFREQLAKSCKSSGDKMKVASFEMKAGQPQRAFEALQDCRDNLNDPPVNALYLKSMAMARKLEAAEEAADTKRSAAAERAEKKKQGVHVGMTQHDVLDCSWGKPQKINRTIMAHSTHEQWVYGIGSYLYFQGGVLTAIQN